MTQGNSGENGVVRWATLHEKGCTYGQHIQYCVDQLEKGLDKAAEERRAVKEKIDRMTWALVLAAISFGSAAVMLGLQLATH